MHKAVGVPGVGLPTAVWSCGIYRDSIGLIGARGESCSPS